MQKSTIFIFSLFLFLGLGLQAQNGLPGFSFYDLDGKNFSSTNISSTKSTMVMLFDPYCDHCNDQAAIIQASSELFKEVQFVFVTIIPEKEPVIEFKEKYFGDTGLDVHVLQDLDFQFETYFGYTDDAINIYLYKEGNKRPKYFGNEVDAETLLKYL